jgi:uncharacterized protein (DUF4415 family)
MLCPKDVKLLTKNVRPLLSQVTPEMFAKAMVRCGLPVAKAKAQVTLRIDSDVLAWFRSQGRGYQTQINQLLRAYMEAHQQ